MALHCVKVGNRDVDIEDDVVGILVSKPQLQSMETEIAQLCMENNSLHYTIRKLRQNLLGYVLEAGLVQSIEPPGDIDDYPFSDN